MIKIFSLSVIVLSFFSCVPRMPYVAGGYEPLVITKKKEFQIAATMRPFKLETFDMSYMITDKLATRLSIGGADGFLNVAGSCLYSKELTNWHFYAGPIYSYQMNKTLRNYISKLGTYYYRANYNCIYNLPGLVTAIALTKNKNFDIILF